MSIIKETKWHPYGCCHVNSFATGAVLIKTEIPSFCLNQKRTTPHNLLMWVPTTWELCLFQVGPFEGCKFGDIWFLDGKRLEPKQLLWQQHYRLFSFYYFSVAVLWHHHWSNLHNRKTSISLKQKREKSHSSVFWKAFQISRKYFSCHRHFNISCSLNINGGIWLLVWG